MSNSDNDWKKRLGTVYSTNPDFNYETEGEEEEQTLPPEKQNLLISLDRKKRKGKTVSLITGFIGKEEDLKDLATHLKKKCGTGGNGKDGEIIIQGDFRNRIQELLLNQGYKAKII
jgi:translation initiation factor 1